MDSVTQLLLGACTAAAVAPREHRRTALVLGAALGTVPDLDVFIDFGGAVENFTMHRGFSHSLFVLPWVGFAVWALLLAWAPARTAKARWLAVVQLPLLTHPLLDALTIYGTQLFWPLETPPVGIGSLFIIDPLYTLPLLVGAIAALRLGAAPRAGFWLGIGLMLSSGYAGWTLYAQQHILRAATTDAAARGLADVRVLALPTPFNSLLWRIVVIKPDGDYYEGYYSFVAAQNRSVLDLRPGRRWLLAGIEDSSAVTRLAWFTHGWYGVEQVDDRVVIKDLRMGVENAYVFRFAVGRREDGRTVAITPEQLPWPPRGSEELRRVWQLMFDPAAVPDQVPATITPATAPAPL